MWRRQTTDWPTVGTTRVQWDQLFVRTGRLCIHDAITKVLVAATAAAAAVEQRKPEVDFALTRHLGSVFNAAVGRSIVRPPARPSLPIRFVRYGQWDFGVSLS